jgi:COP9 signalosome complex subunit 7
MSTPSAPAVSTQDTLKPLLEAIESSQNANIVTIRSLVLKVLSESKLFAGYDQVKATLASVLTGNNGGPEGEKLAKTLDLFSYGTYHDYVKDSATFVPLTDAQIFKLRQLTVLSIVQAFAFSPHHHKGNIIPYQEFQQALGLSTTWEVEHILISCIYAGAFGAKLCQQTQTVRIDPSHIVQTRDVPVSQVSIMIQQLQNMRQAIVASQQDTEKSQQATAQELHHYTTFVQHAQDRKNHKSLSHNERGSSWDSTAQGLVESMASAVRRQKRSRGGGGMGGGPGDHRF